MINNFLWPFSVALLYFIGCLLNDVYVIESFLSLHHLVASYVKNVDERGRNIMCVRTLPSRLVDNLKTLSFEQNFKKPLQAAFSFWIFQRFFPFAFQVSFCFSSLLFNDYDFLSTKKRKSILFVSFSPFLVDFGLFKLLKLQRVEANSFFQTSITS